MGDEKEPTPRSRGHDPATAQIYTKCLLTQTLKNGGGGGRDDWGEETNGGKTRMGGGGSRVHKHGTVNQ